MTAAAAPSEALLNIPGNLRDHLLAEFRKLSKNYHESRWEPSELNGGRLSEIVYSILLGHLSGEWPDAPSKPDNMVDACRRLERFSASPRSLRIQIPRLLIALYEIRNNRNVGHVGGDVDPSHMDATVVFAMSRWIIAELVRVFHSVSTEQAVTIVDSLTERVIPIIWKVDGLNKVLNVGLSASDRMMLLLYATEGTSTSRLLAASLEYQNLTQFRAKVLKPAHEKDRKSVM